MSTSLDHLRIQLDSVDQRILELLHERQTLVREVGEIKAARGLPIIQPDRERAIYQLRREQGQRLELDPTYVEALWRVIHDESCRQQQRVVEAYAAGAAGRTSLAAPHPSPSSHLSPSSHPSPHEAATSPETSSPGAAVKPAGSSSDEAS